VHASFVRRNRKWSLVAFSKKAAETPARSMV
jgi:hypothetical protein